MAFAKKTRKRQLSIFIVDSSAPAISAVFVESTIAKRTAAAKEIAARNQRECTGFGKYLADRIARDNDREIKEWYANQED